jgi:hypothetical protein
MKLEINESGGWFPKAVVKSAATAMLSDAESRHDAEVEELLNELIAEENRWRRWFSWLKVKPLALSSDEDQLSWFTLVKRENLGIVDAIRLGRIESRYEQVRQKCFALLSLAQQCPGDVVWVTADDCLLLMGKAAHLGR